MLDIKWIRDNQALLNQANLDRGVKVDLEKLLELDVKRRELLNKIETLRGLRNHVSQEIGRLNKEKKETSAKVREMQEVGQEIKSGETIIRKIMIEIDNILMYQPNLPLDEVPRGKGDADNQVVRNWGTPPKFDFTAKPHWELGESLGIMDFAAAAKMTGARFCVLKGMGARLERALINFML